jgi:hypothetical protein
LPHIDAPGVPTFVTWRLWGSLPAERVFEREHLTSGEAFVAWDRLLDTARSGPLYLRQPDIARLVLEQMHLVAYAIMPNHVRLLCTPAIALPELSRNLGASH